MNQQIKISKQWAKILGNHAECRFHEIHLNNILFHTTFVPNSISNKIILPD